MKLYAESPGMRSRQIVRDAAVLGWIVLWILLGLTVYRVVAAVSEPAAAVGRGGERLAESFDEVGDDIDSVPVVGDSLEGPFRSAADAGRDLQAEAEQQRDAIRTAALLVSSLTALAAISAIVLPYLAVRLRWAREATAAVALRDEGVDLRLFAFRAVANRPLRELRRVVPDPAEALAAGDYDALANLELQRLGLSGPERLPT